MRRKSKLIFGEKGIDPLLKELNEIKEKPYDLDTLEAHFYYCYNYAMNRYNSNQKERHKILERFKIDMEDILEIIDY